MENKGRSGPGRRKLEIDHEHGRTPTGRNGKSQGSILILLRLRCKLQESLAKVPG